MNDQQRREAILGWQQTVDAAYQQQLAAFGADTEGPNLLDGIEDVIEDGVNGLASLGYAALRNPAAVGELAVGAALTLAGGGVDIGGVGLTATGVGAIAGVPAVVAGAGMVASGGGMVIDGGRRIIQDAIAHPVGPLQFNSFGGKSAAKAERESLQRQQEANDAWWHGNRKANPDGTLNTEKATPLLGGTSAQKARKGK